MAPPRLWEHTLSASFTRPGDTTQYAAGDLVANSTTAGSVEQMEWEFENEIWLRRVRIHKSGAATTNASFRLWLHSDSAVTFANGDNGALSLTGLAIGDVIDGFAVTLAAGATGVGALGSANYERGAYRLPKNVYGFLEAAAGYTPGNAEVFSVTLFGETY
ncbi:MAG: hypothetical protein BroJett013_07290 [Alphaproteobacteria bacterium]|nr:MAG: hypothetical protein BroJett013_07290 [Alphaproteobacteria bacterium]